MERTYERAYLMEYLPKRYAVVSEEQERNREYVYSFKNGFCYPKIKCGLIEKINSIVNGLKSDWIILFIPASTSAKTFKRYSSLANEIQQATGIIATISGITNKCDVEAKNQTNISYDPKDVFSFNTNVFNGKKIILIDDVITSGHSFKKCATILSESGASSVSGLFVAKTVNPNWHPRYNNYIIDIEYSLNIDIPTNLDISDSFEIYMLEMM